ncbi:polyprenyl synthetase family protein [Stetteria hydrogenophila]
MQSEIIANLLFKSEAVKREWLRVRRILEPRIIEVARAGAEAGVAEISEYIVRGGKRLRGFLVVVTAEALGGTVEDAMDAAVAIELVHSASLAIDDIIDRDRERRGALVAWLAHGLSGTILASLLMIPVAQRLTEKYGFKAIMHVIRAWESTVRGEILDAFLAGTIPAKRYPDLASLKTGSLFKLACVLGALAAKKPEAVPLMEEYGSLLGRAYQLADDIVDYKAYLEGRRKLDPSERLFEKWAREVLGARSEEEVIEKALSELSSIVLKTSRLASTLPATSKREILEAIPVFIAERMLGEANLTLLK